MTVSVRDAEERHRYELTLDGELVGLIEYRKRDGIIDLVHTEVLPAYDGHGFGATLARTALDDARAAGIKVIPSCPYVRYFISRHPEYADLVARP
jgi:predicted GNAT family acetyltransferase